MDMSSHRGRVVALSAMAVLAAGVLVVPGSAAPGPRQLFAESVPSVQGTRVEAAPRPDDLSQGAGSGAAAPVHWLSGSGEAEVTSNSRVRVGTLPVWVARAGGSDLSRVKVSVRDRSGLPPAWQNGVVLDIARADGARTAGRGSLAVGYADFAGAFGADWSSRLRFVSVPSCALSTPGVPECQPTPLPSNNDTRARQVSVELSVVGGGGSMVALTAGSSGSAGNFGATSLQASSTWSAGGNAGAFSWNYPLRTPPSLGGPAPQMALAYSSAAVDGRSQATNNQPSWIGEGFDWWPGYIERRYTSCGGDRDGGANNAAETGDQCWITDNATMSLNGAGGELVKDDSTGTWRVKNDDNSTVERLTDTVNGDNDNEYWKIATSDGTQYFFGRNRLPGYTGTAPADKTTNATWTVPVAGNHSGEPCHAATFIGSFCTQAWRWNLDYVVDLHGNTMSLYYGTETNKYGRNNSAADAVSYIRGGFLDHIDYGTDNRSGTDTANTATAAAMRVAFGPADRCLSSCADHANWPDTPWDQDCPGATCAGLYSPTFWTTKRLSTVTTQVWNAAASAYKNVDQWTLTHTFPDPGDGTRAGLWLEAIGRTGKATGPNVLAGDVVLPEINFDWVQMPNRVDTVTDGKFPMNWMRISTIWTDTGGKIDVRYTGADCVPGTHMPASPQTNTLRCYPVLEEQPDHSLKTEYFHKYLVTTVTEADRTGGSPDVVTSYEYVGTPAWRHTDDDGIGKDNLRTWSAYRGYAQVNTRVGDPGTNTRSLSESVFFRGMHGDLDGAGGTRTVTLPAIDGNGDGDTIDPGDAPAIADEDNYSGMVRQSVTFDGVESAPISMSFSEPWQSAPTSSRDMGDTTVHARYTGTKTTWAGTKLAAGGWRVSRVDSTVDAYGMTTESDDQGDLAVTGDEQCTKTTFNRNTAINLLTMIGRVEKYGLRCSVQPSTEDDVISDTRTSFDNQAYGAAPTKGEATKGEVAKAWAAPGGSVWLTQSTAAFDPYGRSVDVTDARGNHTTTAFTPTAGGPVIAVASTTGLGTATSTVEPAWGTPTAIVDMNNKRTEATFDALGRTRQVWQANRLKATFPTTPSASYTYLQRNSGGVNAITTATLNAASTGTNAYYTTTYALFDGLTRPRQTQAQSKAVGTVGTVFTETKYDALGRPASQSQHYDNAVQPSTNLFTIADWQPKTQTVAEYDRAGRTTASVFRSTGTEQWRTTSTYGGDRISVVPPAGGTATTTITDARGRVVERRQYHNPADIGANTRSLYDRVTFHFTRTGDQDVVTDDAGNEWTSTSDLLGRQTASHDPDKGDSSTTYNDAGDALTTTDGRGQVLAFTYDTQGRKTGEYAGSVAPANLLASWAYDPLGFKGQLASSSRWLNNGTTEYKVKIRSYTALYQSTGEDYIIPASLTGLSGTYTISRSYTFSGSPATLSYPAAGGLNGETVTYTYDSATGLPEQLQTNNGSGQLVSNTDYNAYGELSFVQYQMLAGSWLQRSFTYDDITHRLKQATTIRQTAPQAVDNTAYDYDESGNIISIASTPATGTVDTQCLGYDFARRLTEAWTPASGDCGPAPSAAALGGPAPYWHSWSINSVNNRVSQTVHTTGGDTTTNYAYPAAGSAQPHTLSTATTGSTTLSFGYDPAGNTTCRPATAATNTCSSGTTSQALTWDAEGHLATATDTGGTSYYTYTASGARLIADDPTSTTLYLPGTEIKRVKATGALTPTRYYSWAGQTCAMRTTGGAVTWLVGDHQNTQSVAVAAGTQAISVRRQTPYGAPRGGAVVWPNAKGFVGGDVDRTGLTHLGAREYDPAVGRFVSDDPVFDPSDPQSWSGYAYANNTPVTSSDASGLMVDNGGGGGSTQSSSTPGCNHSNAYAAYYCEQGTAAGQVTHTTSAGDTTQQANMNACYQLARARQGCNYDTPPTQQLAQYQQQIEAENAQRAAEVAAAVEADRQAEAARCHGFWGCLARGAAAVGEWTLNAASTIAPVVNIIALACSVCMAIPAFSAIVLVVNILSAIDSLLEAVHEIATTGLSMNVVLNLAEVAVTAAGFPVGKLLDKAEDAAKAAGGLVSSLKSGLRKASDRPGGMGKSPHSWDSRIKMAWAEGAAIQATGSAGTWMAAKLGLDITEVQLDRLG